MAHMDKVAFLEKIGGRSSEELRTLLWTAYWRGTAAARERIEALLNPQEAIQKRETNAWVDPEECLQEVERFVTRARDGDYLRGARDLGRKEVSGWRLTFRRLFNDSTRILQQPDTADDARSLVYLLEFTHDLKDWVYFRTEDPVEAAKIVFSDRVEALWISRIEQAGFGAFLTEAPAQLIRWENPWGWTCYQGATSEKERSLTQVLIRLLPGADALVAFARGYLAALGALSPRDAPPQKQKLLGSNIHDEWDKACGCRANRLDHWHHLLMERLVDSGDVALLERILAHPALNGPETWHILARLRIQQGKREEAQALVQKALKRLPGAQAIKATALELSIREG